MILSSLHGIFESLCYQRNRLLGFPNRMERLDISANPAVKGYRVKLGQKENAQEST